MKPETKWKLGNRAMIAIAVLYYEVLFCSLMHNRNQHKEEQRLDERVNVWLRGAGISNAVVAAHVSGWQARDQGWSMERMIETVNEEIRKIEETKGE